MEKNINSFYEFIKEDAYIDTNRKLRDAIHDIFVDELDYGKEMKLDELSKKLKEKFNILISEEILGKLLFEDWWRNNDYTIFREKDKKWLDVWPFRKTVERKKPKTTPPLGKSKRKIKSEENKPNYGNNYYGGYYGGHYGYNRTWKNKNWRR